MAAHLHFAEHALALHLLLQHFEGLIDIVVTDEDLHTAFLLERAVGWTDRQAARANDARLWTDFFPVGTRREPKACIEVDIAPQTSNVLPIRRNGGPCIAVSGPFTTTSSLAYRD